MTERISVARGPVYVGFSGLMSVILLSVGYA
jgi:hypothetical protein